MSPGSGMRPQAMKWLRWLCERWGLVPMERSRLYDWQLAERPGHGYNASGSVSAADRDYLRAGHPRLAELVAAYRTCSPAATTPLVWVPGHVQDDDLLYFRGDNAYVWQVRGRNMSPLGYALTTYYVKAIDTLGLFARLAEDDRFGNYLFEAAGRLVSRDLLDSLIEIHFLERHLGLSQRTSLSVLDVGAGYGRLAHRLLCAFPQVSEYLLADAVPASTFIAEYYVRARGLGDRAKVVPLNAIADALVGRTPDLAVNIHSFSECTLDAINWWVELLAAAGVRYLFVVPNNLTPGTPSLLNARHENFEPVLVQAGYVLRVVEPKFRDPVLQRYGVNPAYHYLFELTKRPADAVAGGIDLIRSLDHIR